MKLQLVVPKVKERGFLSFRFTVKFVGKKRFYIPLSIPILTSLTPNDVEIIINDENIEEINYDENPDLVGITIPMTSVARRAYEIADNFRKKGVKVVLGGIHPTTLPNEAILHADCVVLGEAEDVWENLIKDFKKGKMKKFYKSINKPDLKNRPIPRRDLLKDNQYFLNVIQTNRGCPFNCEFCSVTKFLGNKVRCRDISQIIEEIKSFPKNKSIFFVDDNFIGNPKFTKELLKALIPLNLSRFLCQTTVNVYKDEKMLRLMKKSNCNRLYIGFESLSEKNLKLMNKNVNKVKEYSKAIKKIRSFGIDIFASFIIGNDYDDKKTFKEIINFINKNNIHTVGIFILAPLPGTKLFERLEKENRILHKNWDKYDEKNVVFQPKNMSVEDLQEGYVWIYRQIYSFDSMYKRLMDLWRTGLCRNNDSIKFKHKILFAIRMLPYLLTLDINKIKYILKVIPKLFSKNLSMLYIIQDMDHNNFAFNLKVEKR